MARSHFLLCSLINRSVQFSMAARFVLAHKSVARERGRRTVTELSTLMLL